MINKEKFIELYNTGITEEELLFEIGKERELLGYEWNEVADIMNSITGKEYGSDKYRKDYNTFKRFYEIIAPKMKDDIDKEYLDEIDDKINLLQKEKYKFFDQRVEYNAVVRKRARQEELNEIIKSCIRDSNLAPLTGIFKDNVSIYKNIGMVIPLNDIHCGYDIESAWGNYNINILKERLEYYISVIKDIQNIYKCNECFVLAGGDMISGNIHADIKYSNNLNIIQQVMTVSEYISEFLSEISQYFPKVNFIAVSGNHSRLDTKENSMKDERLDDLVGWYAEARVSSDNVNFHNYVDLDTTMKKFTLCENDYLLVHGDYDSDINKMLTLQNFAGSKIKAVFRGHLHHNSMDSKDGIKFIMSGSFSGTDNYTISKRIFSIPEQMITIVNQSGILLNYNIELI